MKINYNMSAVVSNKQLLRIEDNLKTSMERLSSGLKINTAKDNPAGMAISRKMHAQIEGLNRASQNASDGVSVIQIADGALSETTSILQRMRELAVQAASDATMSPADKQAIQDEIESLTAEIDRISKDTEYNSKTLLDGTMDTRVYADHATRISISDYVDPATYKLEITKAATQGTETGAKDYTSTAAVGASGTMKINGAAVEIAATDTYAEAFEKIRNAAETGETEATLDASNQLILTSDAYGSAGAVKLTFDDQALATALGFTTNYDSVNDVYVNGTVDPADGTVTYNTGAVGENAEVALTVPADGVGFHNTATVAMDGNKITVTDNGGFSLSFLAEAGYAGDLAFEVTDIGTMTLHIGSNEHQNMEVRIPEVSSESLYIDKVDVTTVNGASSAIVSYDNAISRVLEVRSKLGAYENRLDYSVSSLDTFEENMTSALSRLTDVDMAEEMTNYTQQNVLNQAAISVLTQANDLPQQVLQILQ